MSTQTFTIYNLSARPDWSGLWRTGRLMDGAAGASETVREYAESLPTGEHTLAVTSPGRQHLLRLFQVNVLREPRVTVCDITEIPS